MSIARAFTTRRVKQSIQAADQAHADNAPNRSTSIRHKISSPIELVHTTNMLSYSAPDIHPMSASSTASSQRSDDDMSDSALTNVTTPPTSPDVESPQKRSLSPEPNHLSCFFTVPPGQTPPAPLAQQQQPEAAPVVPQRAASHSKKTYNTLVRQRSASGMSQQSQRSLSTKASFSFSRSSSSSTSTSATSHSSGSAAAAAAYHRSKLSGAAAAQSSPPPAPSSTAAAYPTPAPTSSSSSPPRPQRSHSLPRQQQPPPRREHQHQHQHVHQHQHRKDYSESSHPFGPELAQVSELAEEYGSSASAREQQALAAAAQAAKARAAEEDAADAREMRARGLLRLGAEEYLSDVRVLLAGLFPPVASPPAPARVVAAAVATTWI